MADRFDAGHALVTGGSSGIGKATARLLASRGANVSIIARGQARLDEARAEIAAAARPDRRVIALPADVADEAQVQRAVGQAIGELGPPDVLFTCAGISQPGHFLELPTDVFERTMAVNYFGTVHAVRAGLPAMLERGRGHLVLMSSGLGLMGVFGYSAYAPSKFAVRGLAEVLRYELKPRGIGVTAVYPSDVDTPQLHEENKTKPMETRVVTGSAGVMSPDALAQAIVRGIEKNSFMVAPGMEMGLLARFGSSLLPSLNWYFDRAIARARR